MRVGTVLAALGGIWAAASAPAQETGPSGDMRAGSYELGAVIVTGRPIDEVAGQTTLSVSAAQLDDKGSRTVDQALDTMPGITVRSGGDGVPRLYLRGLPPRHTVIFLNGVPLNSAVDGQFDPSLIPTENIARIDVIEGNSSVLYGPGTTGGVIDIVTRTAGPGLHGDLRGEGGSGSTYLVSGDTAGAGRSGNFYLSGSHAGTDGYLLPDGTRRLNSDKERNNVLLNLGRSAGDWTFGAVGSVLDARQGIAPSTIPGSANDPFAQAQRFERLDAIAGASGQLDAQYRPAGRFSARLSTYVNTLHEIDDRFDNSNYNSMADPTVQTFHEIVDSIVSGGRLLLGYDLGTMGALSSAFGQERQEEHLSGSIRDVPLGKKHFGVEALDSRPRIDTRWAALQYNLSPVERLRLTLGVGENWFDDDTSTRRDTQGMAGVEYRLRDDLQLDASYSRKTRYPTLDELFRAQSGNPALQPEQADDVEAGVRWAPLQQAQIRFSAFDNHVANFIQNNDTTNVFANGNTRVRGFEIVPQAQMTPNLSVGAGYQYLDETDETTGLPVDTRPRHLIDGELDYRLRGRWAIHAWATYTADQVVSSRTTPVTQMHLPDYALFNLRLSRLFGPHTRLYVEADNLFNKRYEFAPGLPGAGQMLIGGGEIGF